MLRTVERQGKLGRALARVCFRVTQLAASRYQEQKRFSGFMSFSLVTGCSVACSYCPQDTFVAAYRDRVPIGEGRKRSLVMQLEDFRALLKKIPKDVRIHLGGFSEPWLNPNCTEMILHAHAEGYLIRVNTTLAGATVDDIRRVAGVPFYQFSLHLPDPSMRIKVDAGFLDVVRATQQYGLRNLEIHHHRDEVNPEVARLVGRFSFDRRALEYRAGNLEKELIAPTYRGFAHRQAIRCSLAQDLSQLKINIVLPNGDVALCCSDWGLDNILGNLRQGDYEALFTSNVHDQVMKSLDDPKLDSICRHCEHAILQTQPNARDH
jgi:radical SAM protein with 4Fe4S-binding SPASM domain